VEPRGAEVHVDGEEERDDGDREPRPRELAPEPEAEVLGTDEALEGDARVGVRDDDAGPDLGAVGEPDPDRAARAAALLDEDPGHGRADADLAAVALELADERAGERHAAAARVVRSVEV